MRLTARTMDGAAAARIDDCHPEDSHLDICFDGASGNGAVLRTTNDEWLRSEVFRICQHIAVS